MSAWIGGRMELAEESSLEDSGNGPRKRSNSQDVNVYEYGLFA